MTIISYGVPRTGTHFVRDCFRKTEGVANLNLNNSLCQFHSAGFSKVHLSSFSEMEKNIKVKFESAKERKDILAFYFWIGEGRIFHPLHDIQTQTNIDWLVERCLDPVYFIRSYRRTIEIYKSMVMGKYLKWLRRGEEIENSKRVSTIVLSESLYHLTMSNRYNIISIDFDRFDNEEYLRGCFCDFPIPKIVDNFLLLVNKKFRPLQERRGEDDIKVSEEVVSYFEEVDRIRFQMGGDIF